MISHLQLCHDFKIEFSANQNAQFKWFGSMLFAVPIMIVFLDDE